MLTEEVIAETFRKLFDPPQKYKPYFEGYKPQFYFKTIHTKNTNPLSDRIDKLKGEFLCVING